MIMMIGWVIMPILCVLIVGIYLYRKVSSGIVYFLQGLEKKKQKILSFIVSAILIIPAINIYGVWFIILLHITVFLLIIDGIVLIFKKFGKNITNSSLWNKIYKSGIIAILLTVIMCSYGRYNIFNVVRTEYTVETQKNIRADGYKLVLISDLHYGITLNDVQLQDVVERINNENADILVLDGDLVDENTTFEQMQSAFNILSQIKSNCGVYYVYGNHDKNDYAIKANYTKEQLADTIQKCGIHILEDETATINEDITLIGRADRGDGNAQRKDISELMQNLDLSQELIVLDHQPSEYKKVESAGGDIILSGHTHAGQIFPAGLLASMFHFDELNYGEKNIKDLHAIVTSGIAGWGYPIRTEKHSEYAVINIVKQQ